VIEYVEAFHRAFGDSPRLFILCAVLVGALLGGAVLGGLAWIVDRGYQKNKVSDMSPPPTKSGSTTKAATEMPKQVTEAEAGKIVATIVQRYKRKHNGQPPTYNWINQRLKDQGQPFIVKAKPALRSKLAISGGTMRNNEVVVHNEVPDVDIELTGVNAESNGIVIENVRPPKPPQ
jgi:hypothetical protein